MSLIDVDTGAIQSKQRKQRPAIPTERLPRHESLKFDCPTAHHSSGCGAPPSPGSRLHFARRLNCIAPDH
jgi:hypothetical protein